MAFDTHEVVSVLHAAAAGEDWGAVKAEILRSIGDLGGWRPYDPWVLGATYIRGGKTSGGIIIPDRKGGMAHNDQLLGKAFLLLAAGPEAFPERLLKLYGGAAPEVGTWFVAAAKDGMEISVCGDGASRDNRREEPGWPCRLFMARDIIAPIPHPGWIV